MSTATLKKTKEHGLYLTVEGTDHCAIATLSMTDNSDCYIWRLEGGAYGATSTWQKPSSATEYLGYVTTFGGNITNITQGNR